ncbi:OstA-like protein [Hoylesella shahii]|uniref:OstA-like protein n=1 Tax=Hoylesella shahii DSM 15611 = JCM 12083 TaxID=1122991 RepID=A0A318HUN1_9BACT|nr:OstA-like protein [Hoylesella shahii]PXX22148.1 OstA-like protein [Hoylesella shahii DSM 15611 = JCM 12083]
MRLKTISTSNGDWHSGALWALLCLFVLSLLPALAQKKVKTAPKTDDRVYLVHSDELRYDQYGLVPDAQIVKGNVQFMHKGAKMWCDSAYFYQQTNSFRAFGHVRMVQGDTLSLTCERAYYDGQAQLMEARKNVWLKHRGQTLNTDSLNYDRLYNNAYFFEGGTLTDKNQKLVADWGQYNTQTREAVFYYNVKMIENDRIITTDTLQYNTLTSMAHVLGPSQITSKTGVIETRDGYLNTKTSMSTLYGRSTVNDKDKTITGDSLYYDDKTGQSEGYGDVVYVDKKNKNSLLCQRFKYNEKTGVGWATGKLLAKDYSQKDTLYVHADSVKFFTYNINTDSVYRMAHCFKHVRAYRQDVQAVCDSMVANSKDSCLTMYRDPIVWNANRQLLGEVIKIYMQDSTVKEAHVLGQALSVEQMPDSVHFNQLSSKDMFAYFIDGNVRRNDAVSNVRSIYFSVDDKDSTLIGLNYLETDTMRMFISAERQLQKIWTCRFEATLYPMSQIPPGKEKLEAFGWFDYVRPLNKDDLFEWRPKAAGSELKKVQPRTLPKQRLNDADGTKQSNAQVPTQATGNVADEKIVDAVKTDGSAAAKAKSASASNAKTTKKKSSTSSTTKKTAAKG